MMQPTVETTLAFVSQAGELDFAAISVTLVQKATTVRSLSHVTPSGKFPPIPSSEWCLGTGPLVLDSINDGVNKLLSLLPNDLNKVRSIASEFECSTHVISRVIIYESDDRPYIELESVIMGKLSMMEARWELDVSDLTQRKIK